MSKSYILQFDKILGDYCITQKVDNEQNESENSQKVEKFSLFSRFFGKNNKIMPKEENFDKDKNVKTNYLKLGDRTIVRSSQNDNRATTPQQNEQGQNNQNNTNPTLQNGQRQDGNQNNVSVEQGIEKLGQVFQKLRTLNMIYQNLRAINDKNKEMYDNMIRDNIGLIGGVINIFNEITSGQTLLNGRDEMPALPSSADEILSIAQNIIASLRDDNAALNKLFNVGEFAKEFNLIESTLANQSSRLNEIQVQSLLYKIESLKNEKI